ncbi:hypothetical protein DEU56DRAFT_753361 [Suillus clintonianus]|uniref:uncharacterized protein n=1 Tax=Suillus clintonianus TaxID=1904413 RepID=UPI001B88471C|nr:uncharacterized protein DEU56DRAFT_753361 [Suillus clintonianus]KAG2147495.1 hypothetical protein DEU56DRAFT_753361 [Suillus clintonianus]
MFEYVHDRASESSSSETSDDDVLVIDPFTTHESPAATLSSPTGSLDSNTQADAPSQPSIMMVLDPTSTVVSWHAKPPSASTTVTVPTNLGEISLSLAPDSDSEVAALVQLPKYRELLCSDKILKNQRPDQALRTKPEVGPRGCHVMGARASCIATRQACKRKIDNHDGVETDKENITISLSHTPAIKRICREKSGTDWQTVLDIDEYGEEQRRKFKDTVIVV